MNEAVELFEVAMGFQDRIKVFWQEASIADFASGEFIENVMKSVSGLSLKDIDRRPFVFFNDQVPLGSGKVKRVAISIHQIQTARASLGAGIPIRRSKGDQAIFKLGPGFDPAAGPEDSHA